MSWINRGFPPHRFRLVGLLVVWAVLFYTPVLAEQPPVELKATTGTRAVFEPDGWYLPREVSFKFGPSASLVRIKSVSVVAGTDVSSASYRVDSTGPDRTVATTLTLASGQRLDLLTQLDDQTPSARLVLTSDKPWSYGLAFLIQGADRIIFKEGSRFTVLRPEDIRDDLVLDDRHIVLQNASTQDGLTITGGEAGIGLRIEWSGSEPLVRVVMTQGRVGGQGEHQAGVRAFRGDSLLAYEDALKGRPSMDQPIVARAEPTSPAEPAQETPPPGKLEFWPDRGRVFKRLKADPREAIFRLGFMVDDKGDTYEDISIGGDMGLLYWQISENERLSLTARGLWTARFDVVSDSFDLLNMDFIGGPALAYQRGPDTAELFFYHQSSHLGDEILDRGDRQRIDYARETIRFLWAHEWGDFRLYGGPSYNIHALPKAIQHKFTMQGGAEYTFNVWNGRELYLALDLQSKQEHDWTPNTSFQVGLDLVSDPKATKNRQWIFGEYFAGHSNMGQYWDRWENYGLIGVGYHFR